MSNIDPAFLSATQIAALGPHAIHQLARRAAGTLTAYRLLLGRCFLAMQRTDLHYQFGCSSAIHYAISQLGMKRKEAYTLRRTAALLEQLPLLSRQASLGRISWSKLREVARVASPETEAVWLQLCATRTYRQIERLTALTGYGQWPGEKLPTQRSSDLTELTLTLDPEARTIVERGLQSMSQEAGKVLNLAEAVEFLFADYLARRPLDEKALAKARHQAAQDLEAQHQRDRQLLHECPARDTHTHTHTHTDSWTTTTAAKIQPSPTNPNLQLVQKDQPHWTNPDQRHPTPKQKQQLLRRDGYCCSTPGCPNHLFLHTHHIVFYQNNGPTVPENLVTLCSRCHRNVHLGHLQITGQAPHNLQFTDKHGRDLATQHDLDTAHWLDLWIGWQGQETDTHLNRARSHLAA